MPGNALTAREASSMRCADPSCTIPTSPTHPVFLHAKCHQATPLHLRPREGLLVELECSTCRQHVVNLLVTAESYRIACEWHEFSGSPRVITVEGQGYVVARADGHPHTPVSFVLFLDDVHPVDA